jgi:hypothetical protein
MTDGIETRRSNRRARIGGQFAPRPNKRRGHVFSLALRRLRDIENIIRFRYGHCLPDTDDVDIFLFQAAYCYLHFMWKKTGKKPMRTALRDRLNLWCERWAPDSSILTQDLVVRDVLRHPRFDNADDCAGHLRLSLEERTQLRITTIGVFGMNKHQRAKLRNRIKAERRRRRHGAVPRTEYLANCLSRTQPWRVLGISRATWFRHRETSVHPASVS